MTARQARIDAEDFERRRAVAALLRGDSLDLEELPRRPNAATAAGAAVALLLASVATGSAYLSGRAPQGWQRAGTLVIDRQTGARFVADGSTLRPAPTLTAALLAGAGRPVLVPHARVARTPTGPALPAEGMPEQPPEVPERPVDLVACARGAEPPGAAGPAGTAVSGTDGPAAVLDVFPVAPPTTGVAGDGLLVRTSGSTGVVLLAGGRAHPLSGDALLALGYSPGQVRLVPHGWLDLVPAGEPLSRLAVRHAGPAGGLPGVGADGDVVTALGSTRRYLVSGSLLHPFLNGTSALLSPDPVRALPESLLLSAPAGPAVGIPGAPGHPPDVPGAETAVLPCVAARDGLVTLHAPLAADRFEPDRAPLRVAWHLAAGTGALLGGAPAAGRYGAAGPGSRVVLLVVDGVGHPTGAEALRALGYRPEQALLLPVPWLRLVAPGVTLTVSTAASRR